MGRDAPKARKAVSLEAPRSAVFSDTTHEANNTVRVDSVEKS